MDSSISPKKRGISAEFSDCYGRNNVTEIPALGLTPLSNDSVTNSLITAERTSLVIESAVLTQLCEPRKSRKVSLCPQL